MRPPFFQASRESAVRVLFPHAAGGVAIKPLLLPGERPAARCLFGPQPGHKAETTADPSSATQERRGAGRDRDGEALEHDEAGAASEDESAGQSAAVVADATPEEDDYPRAGHDELAGPKDLTPADALAQDRAALAEERSTVAALHQRYQRSLQELAQAKEHDYLHLEKEMVELSVAVAREVILRELSQDRGYVVRLAQAALEAIAEAESVNLQVAPGDLDLIESARSRLADGRHGLLRISADAALHPGECMVQAGRTRVDGRLEDRLERVRQALQGVTTEAA